MADIEAGPEGQKAGARLLSIIDDPLPFGKAVNNKYICYLQYGFVVFLVCGFTYFNERNYY